MRERCRVCVSAVAVFHCSFTVSAAECRVCVSERCRVCGRETMCAGERECASVCVREKVCVRERETVCVCERERERVCVCVLRSSHSRPRRPALCERVCERERERESERGRVCVMFGALRLHVRVVLLPV